MSLWRLDITRPNSERFLSTEGVFEQRGQSNDTVALLMKNQPLQLLNQFSDYIPRSDLGSYSRVLNPFNVDAENVFEFLSVSEKGSLLDLSCDKALEAVMVRKGPVAFWTAAMSCHQDLARIALKILVPFATSYLSELAFSQLVSIKTKERRKLEAANLEAQIRLKVTSLEP